MISYHIVQHITVASNLPHVASANFHAAKSTVRGVLKAGCGDPSLNTSTSKTWLESSIQSVRVALSSTNPYMLPSAAQHLLWKLLHRTYAWCAAPSTRMAITVPSTAQSHYFQAFLGSTHPCLPTYTAHLSMLRNQGHLVMAQPQRLDAVAW